MGRYLILLLSMVLLTSCNPKTINYESKDLSTHSSNLTEKLGTLENIKEDQRIHMIETNRYSFVNVLDWFDHETLLYLTDENGVSFVHKFNIMNGDQEIFFQIDAPVIRVEANPKQSVFVMEVSTMKGQRELHFVDKEGRTLYIKSNLGDEVQLYWNSSKGDVVIASLQADYSMDLFLLDLNVRQMKNFQSESFYVQWINETEYAFLKWDMFAPSYYAPLFMHNIETEQELKIADEVIAFFSFNNYLVHVSIKDRYVKSSDYTFIDTKTMSKIATVQIPILNTYSEQWWIPNNDFDLVSEVFYYFEPRNSGDLFQYSDGYSIVSFKPKAGKKEVVATTDENYPIKISPGGRWLLYGYQLENIIDLTMKETTSLVYW